MVARKEPSWSLGVVVAGVSDDSSFCRGEAVKLETGGGPKDEALSDDLGVGLWWGLWWESPLERSGDEGELESEGSSSPHEYVAGGAWRGRLGKQSSIDSVGSDTMEEG